MTENTNQQTNHADRYTFIMEDTIAAMRETLSVAKRLQDANPKASPADVVVALRGAMKLKMAKLEANWLKLSEKQRATLMHVTNAMEIMPEVTAILAKSADASEDDVEAREAKLEEATAKRKASAAKSKATREAKKAEKGDEPASEDMFADAE